jgi:hypothetical protein
MNPTWERGFVLRMGWWAVEKNTNAQIGATLLYKFEQTKRVREYNSFGRDSNQALANMMDTCSQYARVLPIH